MMRSIPLVALVILGVSIAACGGSSSGGGTGGSGGAGGSGGSSGFGGGAPTCAQLCPKILGAHCSNGPTDESSCETGCTVVRGDTACSSQYSALATCAGNDPKYACDASGGVTVTGCESQYDALNSCLATSGG
jgi:hypothetical protein